jgi:hypothetical protein
MTDGLKEVIPQGETIREFWSWWKAECKRWNERLAEVEKAQPIYPKNSNQKGKKN